MTIITKSVALRGLRSSVALAAIIWAGSAHAQVPSDTDANRAQTSTSGTAAPAGSDAVQPGPDIVVTGSRIRGVAPVGSALIEQTRTDLLASGATSTVQLVQNLPQIVNQGVTEGSRGTSGGAGNITYSSGFNIRGIGPFATLTLLNGHRIVQSGSSAASPTPTRSRRSPSSGSRSSPTARPRFTARMPSLASST